MSKTIFGIANECFIQSEFEKAVVIYDFLIKYNELLGKDIFNAYVFNLNLAKNFFEKTSLVTEEKDIQILFLRVLQILKESNDTNHIDHLLSEYNLSFDNLASLSLDIDIKSFLQVFDRIFNKELYAKKNNLITKYDGLLHYYKNYGIPKELKPKFNLDDMKKKIWGGFSNQIIKYLEAVFNNRTYDKKDKAQAALLLGKWYAVQEDWLNTVKYLKKIKTYDESIFRRKRTKLLLTQAMINIGEFTSAESMLEFSLNKEFDSDYKCALSNLRLIKFGAAADEARVNDLNEVYISNGLLPIQINENSGYKFGSWIYPEHQSYWIESGPKISILMPVYGAEDFIEVALNSMLSQTWRNIEIIVVEDCSPDNSWEKIQEIAKLDSRIKIYRNEVNLGAYPTRNKALSLATGDFITVHDSDDWSHPQMLEKQMDILLNHPEVKATCSFMARVNADLSFILRPSRENLEYVHRSYPSLLMRRVDVEILGQWDNISANADDEFIQRARIQWGMDAIVDVCPTVPFSLFLVHENSLTQQKGTSLNSLTFGVRKTYADQAAYWRKTRASIDGLSHLRTDLKNPFPIPQNLSPKNWVKNKDYDIVIISDLSLLGGTRRCNEAYIKNAVEKGLRIGLFHWPRFDLKIVDIADEYYELCYLDNVDLLVPEDEINAKLIIIHHPPILKYEIDAVPKINAEKLMILVNQSPMQRWSQKSFYYDPIEVDKLSERLFGLRPEWIAISGRVKEVLELTGGYNLYSEIWSPPYSNEVDMDKYKLPDGFGSNRKIVIGRHARDHWTKWPQTEESLAAAYCANNDMFEVSLLGGDATPLKLLGGTPSNWNVLEFDSVGVNEFIESLDFFLHFVNEDYIEEFGRNVMEAMALGRMVILPPEFKEIFLDGAVYCNATEVANVCEQYWNNPVLYLEQIKKGKNFVQENCSKQVIQDRLLRAISG